MRTAGLVFAAGASRRMGRNKMLMEIDGVPLVRRATSRAIEAGLSPVIVVVGFEAEAVRAAVADLDATCILNPRFDGPMSASMHVALRALPEDVDGVVVVLGDMIHVSSAMLREVTVRAQTTDAPLVVSRYGDVTAPPILFKRVLFPELLAWHGEGCGKPVVRAHAPAAGYCDWDPASLADVDTPADWPVIESS